MTRSGPDVFLVGAPRCGTTALANFLGQHPEAHVPYVKEPHYFGSDLTERTGFPTLTSYVELYTDADGRRAIDASTWYLHSRTAAQEIREFRPDARIIVMVRDPIELIHSWHGHVFLMGAEPIASFEEALAAEPERRAGRGIPLGTPREALLYRQIPRFAEQIERYLDAFGPERVKVIVHDDFRSDNLAVVRDVCRFLGVDDAFRPEMKRVNSNARPRSRWIQQVLEHQPESVRAFVRSVTSKRLRHRVRDTLRGLNAAPAPRPPLDPALRARLAHEFEPEVERLSGLLGRDLRHWSRTR